MTGAQIAAVAMFFLNWAWGAIVYGVCTYLVFWQDHSGWWYLLAIVLASSWSDDDK